MKPVLNMFSESESLSPCGTPNGVIGVNIRSGGLGHRYSRRYIKSGISSHHYVHCSSGTWLATLRANLRLLATERDCRGLLGHLNRKRSTIRRLFQLARVYRVRWFVHPISSTFGFTRQVDYSSRRCGRSTS